MSLPWRPQSHRGDVIEPGKQMCSALSPPGTNRTKWITHSNGKISDGNTCPRCLEGSTLHENSLPSLLGRLFLIFAIVVLFGCSWHKALTYDEPLLSPPPARNPAACMSFVWKLRNFSYFHHQTTSFPPPPPPPPQSLCRLAGIDINWAPEPHWQSCLVAIAVCVSERLFFSQSHLNNVDLIKIPASPPEGNLISISVRVYLSGHGGAVSAALQACRRWFYSNYATKHTSLPHTSTRLSRSKVAVPQTCPICFLSSRTNVSHLPTG